jgi:methylase of polypeptide subunit release factors
LTSPLRATDPGVLLTLRKTLAEAGYVAEIVALPRRYSGYLPASYDIGNQAIGDGVSSRLQTLVKLLALGRRVPIAQAANALQPTQLTDLQATGLLTVQGDDVIADYALVPYGDVLLAGDIRRGSERDVVSPYTNPSALPAQLTPRGPCRSMLDLGTGSGILALLAADHCRAVTGVDINRHAVMIAGFNARLNGVENATFLNGSWLEPIGEQRFDLIVSNPPYVLSPDNEFTYRDSGLPGAALLERLCQAVPEHLEKDGLAIMTASWPHSSEQDWTSAPATWTEGADCDALVLCYETVDAMNHATTWNTPPIRFLEPDVLRDNVARWLSYCETIGARFVSFGAIVLRRRERGNGWVTALKAPASPGDRAGDHLTWLLDGQDENQTLDDRGLMARALTLPDGIAITQRFQRREELFVARPAMVKLEEGLGVSAAIDPDALDVLFACDGRRPLSQIVNAVAERRDLTAESVAQIAIDAARELLAHGLLAA